MKISFTFLFFIYFLLGFKCRVYSQEDFAFRLTLLDSTESGQLIPIRGASVYLYVNDTLKMKTKTDLDGMCEFYERNRNWLPKISLKIQFERVEKYISNKEILKYHKEKNRGSRDILVTEIIFHTKKTTIHTPIKQLTESPEIRFPYQKGNIKSINKQKSKSVIKTLFSKGLNEALYALVEKTNRIENKIEDRIENIIQNRKNQKKNNYANKIYTFDKDYTLYTTLKDSLAQNNPNSYHKLVNYISKKTKKTKIPTTIHELDNSTFFQKTTADFCFGRDINTFYYKGKSVDISPKSDIYIVYQYKCEKPFNYTNATTNNNSYFYDYIWTTNFKEYYLKDKLIYKSKKKVKAPVFTADSPYFKFANALYYFDEENQSIIKIDSIGTNYTTCGEILYDSIHTFYKNTLCTYQNEPITHAFKDYFKTNTKLLQYAYNKNNFKEIITIDGNSFSQVTGEYFKDKNDFYYKGKPMFIHKDNFEKIHFYKNSKNYLTDGEQVYFKGKKLKNFDYRTFNALTDYYFYDKNGVYFIKAFDLYNTDSICKIPFKYSKPILNDSVNYLTYNQEYLITYYNQVYDFSTKLNYYNVPKELLNKETFNISDLSLYVDTNVIYTYNNDLRKTHNKLLYKDLKIKVDIKTFKCISSNSNSQYFIDKDFVYLYNGDKGFSILDSISPKKFKQIDSIPELVQDDQFLYFENYKLFNLKNLKSIDKISFIRHRVDSFCGLGNHIYFYSKSYLVKTNDETWLLNIEGSNNYNFSNYKQSVAYRKLSFFERKYINSLNEQKTISLKRVFTSK